MDEQTSRIVQDLRRMGTEKAIEVYKAFIEAQGFEDAQGFNARAEMINALLPPYWQQDNEDHPFYSRYTYRELELIVHLQGSSGVTGAKKLHIKVLPRTNWQDKET